MNTSTRPELSPERLYCAVFWSPSGSESVRRSVALGGIVAVVLLLAFFTSQTHAASAAVENQLTSLTISTFLGALAFVAMVGSCMSAARWKRMRDREIIGATRIGPSASNWGDSRHLPAYVPNQLDSTMVPLRVYALAPLSALNMLVQSLDPAVASGAQQSLIVLIRSAVQVWSQVLFDSVELESHKTPTAVLDESPTDLRQLINAVAALFHVSSQLDRVTPNISLDDSVSALILTDASRLGQIVFHMIRTVLASCENRHVFVTVRAEPINAGSQRIVIDVRQADVTAASASRVDFEFDATLAYCRMLTERMGGTLRLGNGYAAFEAPFTIHAIEQHDAPSCGSWNKQACASIVLPFSAFQASSKESFDRSYLDALVKEGINLQTFLRGWHHAMNDDIACMSARRNDYQVATRSALHKLSGATGLVGAKRLTTALREASAATADLENRTIDVLTTRLQTLMTQLEEAEQTCGSERR